MTEAKAIANRIEQAIPGTAFTAFDFSDISSARNAGNVLGRMYSKGKLAKAIRGVYYVPRKSELLDTCVPASVDEVVKALARANKWIVAPAGDAALNMLGLDTQVPAKFTYVSSGPYKTYEYDSNVIELLHRANRDLLDCSQITCVIVQAMKALGREQVDQKVVHTLACNLSEEQVDTFFAESSGLTSWMTEVAKAIWEEKHGQNS